MRPIFFLSLAALLLGSRADTTEAEEAALTDPTAECAYFPYAPVDNAVSSFPPTATPVAAIMSGDTAGQAKFDAMKANIPNIAPKGTDGVIDKTIQDGYDHSDPDCWWTNSLCTTPKLSGLNMDIAVVPEPRTLGYGFDDGPNCSHNAFYDYLTSKNQKATMFFIGTNVMNHPLQAIRAVNDGHEICVHTWSHRQMTALTNEQVFGELWYTMQLIKLITGYTPTCWRPPQGDVDDRVRYIAQQLGLDNILWKYDADDWMVGAGEATPDQVQANYDYLVANVSAGTFDTIGAIFLTHELDNYTMQTAVDNYPKLAAAFDHIVPVGVAYNKTQLYVETNFTQPDFAQYVAARGGSTPSNSSPPSSSGSGNKAVSASTVSSAHGSQSTNKSSAQDSQSTNKTTGTSAGVPLWSPLTGFLALVAVAGSFIFL
ncbi:Carbohydrate esterase family 4 protein [Mycena sanguinolenta]|uniref:chitin deacetylase n=1 Tax=Mycena sanguinolenta TaxID=230812 RepID=A0A8H6Z9D5_9AGAR|nr:Carbohydrate esterase family 4 protein [Mycena sanguinolenta]